MRFITSDVHPRLRGWPDRYRRPRRHGRIVPFLLILGAAVWALFAQPASGLNPAVIALTPTVSCTVSAGVTISGTTITGTNGGDTIDCSSSTSDLTIYGLGGNDRIKGGSGNDTIYGGAGNDLELRGGDGNDQIFGEGGNDNIYGDGGDDTIDGGTGNNDIWGGDGNDTITGGDGNDNIRGEAGNDTIFGRGGNDRISGGDGDDILHGEGGADDLDGGPGDDCLTGGDGIDTLTGGDGNDSLSGGNAKTRSTVAMATISSRGVLVTTVYTDKVGAMSSIAVMMLRSARTSTQLKIAWATSPSPAKAVQCAATVHPNSANSAISDRTTDSRAFAAHPLASMQIVTPSVVRQRDSVMSLNTARGRTPCVRLTSFSQMARSATPTITGARRTIRVRMGFA